MWPVLFPALLTGCGVERGRLTVADDVPDDSAAISDTSVEGPTDTATCANPIVSVTPADGALDVPLDAVIAVGLAAPEDGVLIRVRAEGRDVVGRTDPQVDVEAAYAFSPLQILRAGVEHTLVVAWSCGSRSSTFTPRRDTWRLDLPGGERSAPQATEELERRLDGLVDPPWLGLDALFAGRAGDGRIEWVLAAPEGPGQAPCAPTARVAGRFDGAGATFEASASRATLRAGSVDVLARGVVVSGAVVPGTRSLTGVRVEATLDLRSVLTRIVGPTASLADLCRSLDSGCSPCDDGASACTRFVWDGVPAVAGGPPIAPRDAATIAADPACAP